MIKSRTVCEITLVSITITLFLILSTASAATVEYASPTITETRITTSGSATFPSIYDDRIIWVDNSSGNWDIYMYNLSTQKKTQITTEEYASDTAIYGDRIVWESLRDGFEDIYMYDLSTKEETEISGYGSGTYHFSPAIYGDKIVWIDWSIGGDIYIYDLSTHKATQITDNESALAPDIYGDRIVWVDDRNGDGNIYMYNLSTSEEIQITNSGSVSNPNIYGSRIVWEDYRNGNLDIYMYNLSTSIETQVNINGSDHYSTDLHGDRIVWIDARNGNYNYDVYMYDFSTNKETRITTSGSAEQPAIYGDRIVWVENRDGKTDIYMADLNPSLLLAEFSASPTSGKAPLKVQFTDKSTGSPTKWKWNFGDGTSSTAKNPTHKYCKAGTYAVKLTATNAEGSNTVTKTDYIKVVTKPVAAFSAKPTSGKAPLTVAFTDKSTGIPTAWKWTFGDGASSTEQNPKHEYSQEGNYKVTLTVTNAAGSSIVTKTNFIKVTTSTRPGIYSENK